VNSEKKHLIQSSISSYESNNKAIAAVPTVIELSGRGDRAFDIYSRLLRERIIFLGTGINDQVSDSLVAQLLFLEAEDPEKTYKYTSILLEAQLLQEWPYTILCNKYPLM